MHPPSHLKFTFDSDETPVYATGSAAIPCGSDIAAVSHLVLGGNAVPDPNVENYKKALSAIVEKQGKDIDQLQKVFEDGKKAVLRHWDPIRNQLIELLKKVPVPPKSDEKELAKVSEWLEESIKKKFAKCTYFLSPSPEVKLDAKAKKMVEIGIGFGFKC